MHSLTLNQPILIKQIPLELNLRFFWGFAFVLILALLVVYIFQINKVVSEGYLLQEYQRKTEKLVQENEKLETNLAGMGSLGNIENLVKELNLEKIGKIHYIQILESSVVTK